MNSSRRAGTSLVEILVVIVVFLVGILAIVQIFPGGFRVLSTSAKNTIATTLARAEVELVKNHLDQLPDAITPVRYVWTGTRFVIATEPDRSPNDLGPSFGVMDQNGIMYDGGGNNAGYWQYLAGSNVGRRVIGEGRTIPTPRLVGSYYGSLLTLQFAPIFYDTSTFIVFGNDLSKHEGDPIADGFPVRPTDYYISNEDGSDASLTVAMNSNKVTHYRVSFTAYAGAGRTDYVDVPFTVAQGSGPEQFQFGAGTNPILGTAISGIEYDSVKVERQFDDVSGLAVDDWGLGAGIPNPDPYEYKLLSPQLGQVLFNPAGYNYIIRSHGRRTPLLGRVSYDVYDWRIIHDEFRMPDVYPAQYRLAIGSLKIMGEQGPDGLVGQGIGIQAPDSAGTMQDVNLVLEDADTGGLYVFQPGTNDPHLTSYVVNGGLGLIRMLDYDGDPSNGTQLMLLMPGAVTPTTVTVNGRNLRALYMGKNEWAVQVMKPAAVYTETWSRPGIGQFYIGGSSALGGNGSYVYFPVADGGRMISLGEVYYYNQAGQEVGPVQLTAKAQTNNLDGLGLPYIPIAAYLPDFRDFDYSYGSAVKDVKGASVAVRVLWNPEAFHLSADSAANMDQLNKWIQSWRRSTVETYLQRGN